ncbi:MAG: hypothetical protein LC135_01780 [Phycisphaerae bacterium]|nr:hypothetical protein [Phycisphaerae bacterium]MCZ2398583.1 hypothetical protein [Phycisphaerae bacterium]
MIMVRGEYQRDVRLVSDAEAPPHVWHRASHEWAEESFACVGGDGESVGLGNAGEGETERPVTAIAGDEAHDEMATIGVRAKDWRGNESDMVTPEVVVVSRPPAADVRVIEVVSGRVRLSFE